MPCVGFILRPQKRPRVLTATLSAAAEARGLSLLALDPSSTPEQWQEAGVDVIVHKVPDEPGLDQRLESWASAAAAAAAAADAQHVLLDPPSAVRQLQDRQQMLAPLAGELLILTQQACTAQHGTADPGSTVTVTIPKQTVLLPGCTAEEAVRQMATAGLQYPVLVKPLVSAVTDSARLLAGGPSSAADGSGSDRVSPAGQAAAAAAAAATNDGHTLGVIFTQEGLHHLVAQQLQQQNITLPAVLQQYVAHEALYKLYVIGPSCVLTRRNTITPAVLESAPAGKQGVVILPRLSADKLAAVAAAQQQQATALQDGHKAVHNANASGRSSNGGHAPHKSSNNSSSGTALADSSVQGDPLAPPLWAMQQLAVYLRKALGMNLFNVDIIAPSSRISSIPSSSTLGTTHSPGPCQQQQQQQQDSDPFLQQQQQQQQQQQLLLEQQTSAQELLVVDINYFPGYDKVPGAELLFADFLAECAADAAADAAAAAAAVSRSCQAGQN